MTRPTCEHQGRLRRLQLVMTPNDADLSPEEIAGLIELAGSEHQTIAEMDECWEKLRASHRARKRLQHLSPSEIEAALMRSRQLLGEGE